MGRLPDRGSLVSDQPDHRRRPGAGRWDLLPDCRNLSGILEKLISSGINLVFVQYSRTGVHAVWKAEWKGLQKENASPIGFYSSGRDSAGLYVEESGKLQGREEKQDRWEKPGGEENRWKSLGREKKQMGKAGKRGIKQMEKYGQKIERLRWTGAGYAASYTVEMAYIMAVFCLVLVVFVQQAYRLHDETKCGMTLHEAVERMRHDEDDRSDGIMEEVQSCSGLLLSMDHLNMEFGEKGSKITGRLSGSRPEGAWNLEISSRVYEPEEFLRKVAALKQLEERYEGQIQEGDAP